MLGPKGGFMIHIFDTQPHDPDDPVSHPVPPDTPNPVTPEGFPDPPPDPGVFPVNDTLPGSDPDTEPVREPEPIPPFPEPIPGTEPDVLV